MGKPPPIPLPRGWPAHAKSALLHAVSLARVALIDVRSGFENSPLLHARQAAEIDRLRAELARVNEECRILRARLAPVPAPKLPSRGASDEAEAALNSFLERHASHPLITEALVARGEYVEVAPFARRLLSRVPDHPLGLKALAVAHITAGRHDEALPLLRRGVALYPGDAEMHSNLAIALAVTGHSRESLARIEAALAIAPDRAEFHTNRAATLLQLGALDAAIESCRTAIRLNPQQADAHNTLGAALHRKRQFAEALEAFQAAATINPESLDAFVNFVVTLSDLGRYEEAARCARKVLEDAELSQREADALLPHLCAAERACCDWRRADLPAVLRDTMRRRVDQGPEPFFMTHIEEIERATLRQGAETYGRASGNFAVRVKAGGKPGKLAEVLVDGADKNTLNGEIL